MKTLKRHLSERLFYFFILAVLALIIIFSILSYFDLIRVFYSLISLSLYFIVIVIMSILMIPAIKQLNDLEGVSKKARVYCAKRINKKLFFKLSKIEADRENVGFSYSEALEFIEDNKYFFFTRKTFIRILHSGSLYWGEVIHLSKDSQPAILLSKVLERKRIIDDDSILLVFKK